MVETAAAVLKAESVHKSFGPNEVLTGIDFDLCAGEAHGLIGENGAGKSTLMKILSGFEPPTQGRLVLDGVPVAFRDSEQAEGNGVVLIHQEFNLAEHLSVEANIFLGRELHRGPLMDVGRMRRRSREVLAELEADIDPRQLLSDLSVSDKQLVEIAKAVSRNVRVLIMDEPTAVLTQNESRALFRLIERLKQQGVAILFTSHKLDEIRKLTERVTVLRDGQWITTRDSEGLSEDEMARLMVGREVSDLFPEMAAPPQADSIPLEVEGLRVPGFVDDASFALRRGEVLGFAGLIGAGRTELMEGLMGLRRAAAGVVRRDGEVVSIGSPRSAARHGIAYLTEDRKGCGLLVDKSLTHNLTMLELAIKGSFFIDTAHESRALDEAIETFNINVPGRDARVSTLSGGNQQKLLLAKTMLIEPEIIVFDEPTRGIDIGTKQQIYAFIEKLAKAGKSCVVISSEMQEVIGLCHRVVVMRRGRVSGELEGSQIEENAIVRLATGVGQGEQGEMDVASGH